MSGAFTAEAEEERQETRQGMLRNGVLRALQYECWYTSEAHGWHDKDRIPTWEEIDLLVDTDPMELRDLLWKMVVTSPPTTFGDRIALIESEASEALEEYRNGHDPTEIYYNVDSDKPDKPEGVPVELADVIIRTLDFAQIYGIDLAEALQIKMAYNETRPYRHGGKVI